MLPQLDATTYASQIFWLVISFVLLYIGIARHVLPRMRSVLQQRAFRIESDMQKAEEFRKEAEAILTEYDRLLEHSRSTADQLIIEAKQQAKHDVAVGEANADEEVRKKIHIEHTRIEDYRHNAKKHLDNKIPELCKHIMSQLSLKEISK